MNVTRVSIYALGVTLAFAMTLPTPVQAAGPRLCYSARFDDASDGSIDLPTAWYANNERGQRVGAVTRPSGDREGVIFDRGRYSFVSVGGAGYTELYALNNRGTAGGVYLDGAGNFRPFLYDIKTGGIDKPNLADPTAVYQEVTSINDFGVVGAFYLPTFSDPAVPFVARERNGVWDYTVVPLPGTGGGGINDINNRGDVVGNFLDANGVWHGFLITRPGTRRARFHQLDEPGSTTTFVYGVNDFRWVTGLSDARISGAFLGASGAFVHRFRRGDWIPVDVPQATQFTFAADINNFGQVVGFANDGSPGQGFIARLRLCR